MKIDPMDWIPGPSKNCPLAEAFRAPFGVRWSRSALGGNVRATRTACATFLQASGETYIVARLKTDYSQNIRTVYADPVSGACIGIDESQERLVADGEGSTSSADR